MTDSVSQALNKDGNVVTASAAVIEAGIKSGELTLAEPDVDVEVEDDGEL